MPLNSKAEVTHLIELAFAGVTLGDGLSLEQSKVVDNYGRGVTSEQFSNLPKKEITDNWAAIPLSILDKADCLGHLDPKGFKYYIPALMLRLLDAYDSTSMMTIGTLSALYPKTEDKKFLYSELSENQRHAIAKYLVSLPSLIDLDTEDKTIVERAARNYWSKYLD